MSYLTCLYTFIQFMPTSGMGNWAYLIFFIILVNLYFLLPQPGWKAPLWKTWSWPSGIWTLAAPSAFAPLSGTPPRCPVPYWSRRSRPRWRWTLPAWGRIPHSPPPSRYWPPAGRPTCFVSQGTVTATARRLLTGWLNCRTVNKPQFWVS